MPLRLWAMLDGKIASRLFVDDSEVPTLALLQELAEGTVYIGGRPTPELLTTAIHDLRRKRKLDRRSKRYNLAKKRRH